MIQGPIRMIETSEPASLSQCKVIFLPGACFFFHPKIKISAWTYFIHMTLMADSCLNPISLSLSLENVRFLPSGPQRLSTTEGHCKLQNQGVSDHPPTMHFSYLPCVPHVTKNTRTMSYPRKTRLIKSPSFSAFGSPLLTSVYFVSMGILFFIGSEAKIKYIRLPWFLIPFWSLDNWQMRP